ncbi:hypothetical protein HAX54_052953 [Datura stramonium]|uniref:Uncharacterized protein n=1 Tax=Datura stramonium TaxID=4076 RepID=A0ABS8T1W9_DATST|nr:hypothetical protein [Datura stramonium]
MANNNKQLNVNQDNDSSPLNDDQEPFDPQREQTSKLLVKNGNQRIARSCSPNNMDDCENDGQRNGANDGSLVPVNGAPIRSRGLHFVVQNGSGAETQSRVDRD